MNNYEQILCILYVLTKSGHITSKTFQLIKHGLRNMYKLKNGFHGISGVKAGLVLDDFTIMHLRTHIPYPNTYIYL